MTVYVREARFPDDAAAIAAIDTSFSTDLIYDVEASGDGFALRERRSAKALTKRFPLDDLYTDDRSWSHAFVAEADGRCVGFAAAGFETWNRRLVLWHLYVDPPARGQGVGRLLVDRIADLAQGLDARHIWLETTNLNHPGVAAYRALGFTLAGLDTTLYDSTPAEGEVALFFSRPVTGGSASLVSEG
jgi:GNAT superfamily N-acetyltransferase